MSDKEEVSRHFKQFLMVTADLIWLPLALWLAIAFRWGDIPYTTGWQELLVYAGTALSSVLIFLRFGLYRAVVRFMGAEAFIAVVKGVSISALLLAAFVFLTRSTE
ncbi:MAG TPA: polysaccharide biosynthesis protein, partial [Aeromonadales bacterium]|nr:polysaccharide biosynthesis protein [Aeromonadales bacterium]